MPTLHNPEWGWIKKIGKSLINIGSTPLGLCKFCITCTVGNYLRLFMFNPIRGFKINASWHKKNSMKIILRLFFIGYHKKTWVKIAVYNGIKKPYIIKNKAQNLYNTHAAFRNTRVAFRNTHVAFRNTHAAFRNTHAAFRNTHAAFRNTRAAFRNTRAAFRNTRAAFRNTRAAFR